MKSIKDERSKLILKVTDLQSKLSVTCQCLKEEIEKRNISEIHKQLTEAKDCLRTVIVSEVKCLC